MRKLTTLSALALSVALVLSACRKEEDFASDKPISNTSSESALELPAEGEIRIEMEADAELPNVYDEQGRLSMRLEDRPGYANEFYPQTYFTMGNTVHALLVFVREKENESEAPITFTWYVEMEVIDVKNPTEADRNKGAKGKSNRLAYRGNVPMPASLSSRGYSFRNDVESGNQKWHVMSLLGWTQATYTNDYVNAVAHYGDVPEGVIDPETYFYSRGAKSVDRPTRGDEFNLNSIPYISNWRPLKLGKKVVNGQPLYSGSNFELEYQPQGSIIQVDVAYNVSTEVEARRYGIASNVLNFSGQYDLSGAALYERWRQRDADGKGALPTWKPNTPRMGEYTLHYVDGKTAGLSSSEEGMFPWHLPQFNSAGVPSYGKAKDYAGAKDVNTSGFDVAAFQVVPLESTSVEREYYTNGSVSPNKTIGGMWTFARNSGVVPNNKWYSTRRLFLFWGMPRETMPAENERATYVFTSAYSKANPDEIYSNGSFDPATRITKMSQLVSKIRKGFRELDEKIAAATAAGNTTLVNELQTEKNTYNESWRSTTGYPHQGTGQELMQHYSADSALFYSTYMPEALRKHSVLAQPLVTLYQTKATFAERKISHIQTALTADLMFSKVVHKQEDGQNYSLVELRNPGMINVDLKQYAIARLVPSADGSYLQYRRADGQRTNNLSEAAILPLKSILGGAVSPFEGSAFPNWSNHIAGDYAVRYRTQGHGNNASVTFSNKGMYEGKTINLAPKSISEVDGQVILYKDQSIIIGASGYINAMPDPDQKAWWNKLYNTQMKNASVGMETQLYLFRHFYSYADGVKVADATGTTTAQFGEGTLDIQPTDGLVLLRGDGQGGWQVIDATAPIGPKSMGSYVSYAEYKAWLATQITQGSSAYYAITRKYGKQFPVLPPYSTARKTAGNQPDDWTLTEDEDNFFMGAQHTYRYKNILTGPVFWLQRTPIDPAGRYATYWRNIPRK